MNERDKKDDAAARPRAQGADNEFTLDKETLRNLIIGATGDLDPKAGDADKVRGGSLHFGTERTN